MNSEKARELQWEWYRQLASLDRKVLAAQATETNLAAIQAFVAAQLPDHPLPPGLAGMEFADAVLRLRQNDRAWNRSLMEALIRADDLVKEQNLPQAVATLRSFSSICPWRLYAEVALNQVDSYANGEPAQ
ncbi:hypothetical protein [Acidovorax sp.]|uniref:hypothetical protein n=1 Tax=Acidovorax sp. TaxID=1872122 RepID=UPI00391F9151